MLQHVSFRIVVALAVGIALAGWYVSAEFREVRRSAVAAEPPPQSSPTAVAAPEGSKNATSDSATSDSTTTGSQASAEAADPELKPVPKTPDEWKKILSPQAFKVLRQHDTERAFTGEYWNSKKTGLYRCAGCGMPLFDSTTKFDSGTGWPSFYQPVDGVPGKNVGQSIDHKMFVPRVEVHCNRCGGHLGHVFSDGPQPTGLRYCINSVSIKLDEKGATKPKDATPTDKK